MPNLTKAISPKNLDIIRAKIGAILVDELPNIATLNADTDLDNIQVQLERFTPLNENEYLPRVIVRFTGGNLIAKDAVSQRWSYNYAIMCYASVNEEDGDRKASLLVTKILGIINEILNSSYYLHLDLPKPMIFRTEPQQIEIMDSQDNQESMNISVGGLNFMVETLETQNEIDPTVLEQHKANMDLFNSNKGFEFIWDKE